MNIFLTLSAEYIREDIHNKNKKVTSSKIQVKVLDAVSTECWIKLQ